MKSNLVYFVAVCVISFLFGFLRWLRCGGAFAVKQKHITVKECAYIELDLASLAYNAAILQAAMPQGSELMAVVKANAYGHRDYEISTHLEKNGVKAFAVATIEEGSGDDPHFGIYRYPPGERAETICTSKTAMGC